MTSAERIFSYTQIESEPGYEMEIQPPENWPTEGSLQVDDLSLVYYEGGPKVLNEISFSAKPQEKIGVAGRTGAGKSSLVSALLRMPEPTGYIIVDGINIGSLNIQGARHAFSVIAQDPILFTGPLRMNLDPFERYSDNDIWQSLEDVGLKHAMKKLPRQLLTEVRECGANFSVGERQLLCLARALLLRNKIIVLDEATANVDYETDRRIQETIRSSFQECTVITIAHRLNTIMDYDKILVLSNGKVVEFDKPDALIKKEGGHFAQLYRSSCSNQA